uniref:Uncharacterized protein n=1 Tax=Picea sitchensis TaxID=3332 RepID=A9NXV8_PICSI|nr:unknown [Picea sitchensis]
MAEKLVQDSCAVCKSTRASFTGDFYLGPPEIDSVTQIKRTEQSQSTMDSNNAEILGSQKHQHHGQEHQQKRVKGGKLKKGQLHLTEYVKKHRSADPEHCSLASSLYYGGPDEHYDSLQTTQVDQDEQQKIKMEVKQLQEAMDPFNLEYATRGNWWKGSLYY